MCHCKSTPKNTQEMEMYSLPEKITGRALGVITMAILVVIALSAAA